MACNLCFRQFGPRRKGCCATCARFTIYEPRLQQVATLLERENSHAHVEAIVRPGNDGVLASLPQDANWDAIAQGLRADSLQRQRQDIEAANARLASVLDKAKDLKSQMGQYRDHIDRLRSSNERRKSELGSKKEDLSRHISVDLEPWESGIRKTSHRLQRTHHRLADAKAYLCYTASLLAGVRQEVDQRRKLTGRTMLAGLVVPDLREASGPTSQASVIGLSENHQQFQHINACLDNICRLLATWAYYLSVSLPAEIVLPHNDFPHAAILPEKSSYRGLDIPYPAGTFSHNASPSASRVLGDVQHLPRPRLLHLDRPLAKLAKEDAKAFGLFVEGVVLLSWNLAWLCKTQGVTAINTFDEFCDIGRNLWLFHRAADFRAHNPLTPQSGADTPGKTSRPTTGHGVRFGELTHGTVLHSLAGYEGAAIMQNWRLAQPHRLVDKLRSYLLTEMTGAEWDVLSEKDFDDDREDEVAVLVGGSRSRRPVHRPEAMSVMSIAPPDTDGTLRHEKGWMKVRGRGSET